MDAEAVCPGVSTETVPSVPMVICVALFGIETEGLSRSPLEVTMRP